MLRYILTILATYFLLTGIYIFAAPVAFYENTPGLSDMGPYNFHFIRDVALIFLVSGGALLYGALKRNKGVAIAGAAWPFLHGLFHLQIWAHRGFPFDQIALVDMVAVILPGMIALGLALKFNVSSNLSKT